MAHRLVTQLRFARSEFVRCLEGVTAEEGVTRLEPMNCISWIVGHLAVQEQAYWVLFAQGKALYPDLYQLVGYGSPPSTPPLDEMWAAWREITAAADQYLDGLTEPTLGTFLEYRGEPRPESVGTLILRNMYHYWYHTGEAHAIRQMLGHQDLPQFVGDFGEAIYTPRPEG
jgi:uncharacterized damage-inducible protein DinB